MAQQVILNVADPEDQIEVFGTGAVARLERDTVSTFATTNELTTIELVPGKTQYEYADSTGTRSDFYRWRYSTADPLDAEDFSDYSEPFQVGSGPLEYATEGSLKELLTIPDTEDDTLLAVICDRVNQFIETETLQPIGPIPSATYTYDGNGLTRIFTPTPVDAPTQGIGGLREVSLVELAPYTAGTFETIATTDYFLRGRHGVDGPYKWLVISDLPAGTYRSFRNGRGSVRVTATAGWATIPKDLEMVALELARRAWNGRGSHEAVDENGLPVIRTTGQERSQIRKYRLSMPAVIGD